MKISKNTWHYKVASMIAGGRWFVHDNLCGYFRQVILGLFVLIFGALASIGMVIVLFAPFIFENGSDIALASMLLWGVVGFFAFFFARDFREDFESKSILFKDIIPEARISVPKNSFTKVAGAYLRAAKDKVCPMLDFE